MRRQSGPADPHTAHPLVTAAEASCESSGRLRKRDLIASNLRGYGQSVRHDHQTPGIHAVQCTAQFPRGRTIGFLDRLHIVWKEILKIERQWMSARGCRS